MKENVAASFRYAAESVVLEVIKTALEFGFYVASAVFGTLLMCKWPAAPMEWDRLIELTVAIYALVAGALTFSVAWILLVPWIWPRYVVTEQEIRIEHRRWPKVVPLSDATTVVASNPFRLFLPRRPFMLSIRIPAECGIASHGEIADMMPHRFTEFIAMLQWNGITVQYAERAAERETLLRR